MFIVVYNGHYNFKFIEYLITKAVFGLDNKADKYYGT